MNSNDDAIQVSWIESPFLNDALAAAGFSGRRNSDNYSYTFLPCPVGTFSNFSSKGAEGCIQCPPGMLEVSPLQNTINPKEPFSSVISLSLLKIILRWQLTVTTQESKSAVL